MARDGRNGKPKQGRGEFEAGIENTGGSVKVSNG